MTHDFQKVTRPGGFKLSATGRRAFCNSLRVSFSSSRPLLQAQVDPRGARPIEHGHRADKCATQKEWPFCTDDDWGTKCPSGCRIQGLMDKYDHDVMKSIERIRHLLEQNQVKQRSTDQVSKQTYDYLREKLVVDSNNDNTYYNLAQSLRQRIVEMKIKIDRQLRLLAAMKDRVKDQVMEMQRLEVDIDIKLRSCKGSCQTYAEYSMDQDSYVALDKQMNQLESQSAQSIETVGTLYVMKSRPLKDAVVEDRNLNMCTHVKTVQLVLEQEGSSTSSPATVSKVPGTSHSTSSSSSSSSSSSIRKTTVHTTSGPVEKTEEVIEGGPECQGMTDLTKGGTGSLFPSLSHTSSSSSFTKTVSHSGGAKTGFANPFGTDVGIDLGAFLKGNTDDDVPDFHARTLNNPRVERQADYVGKDCADIQQKHLKGETNGLFKVKPGGLDSKEVVEVYCQQEGLMGGWMLVQQRESEALSFNRTWAEYHDGFGSVDAQGKGNVWLGNKYLHLLTSQVETMLKVELEDWEGGVANAEYTIRVGSEAEGFPLHVSGYTGDAGDALVTGVSNLGSFLSHNGMKFSTFDKDSDKWEENCAEMYGGGWWYNNCQSANLNGIYYKGQYDPGSNSPYEIENGVVWVTYKPADYSLKTVRMFVRPAAF
uniref:Fibrinogen alpha chain n=1 Tax=Myripristis murdjan TaxID=586833 RepID=A0A667YTS2_9TELE